MNKNISDLTFEQALTALEKTVAQLEAGNLPLEESLKLFEQGQELTAYCNKLLEEASLKVEQLTADGEIVDISPHPEDD
jgi:exodeoxyribonuclease VII small subunit